MFSVTTSLLASISTQLLTSRRLAATSRSVESATPVSPLVPPTAASGRVVTLPNSAREYRRNYTNRNDADYSCVWLIGRKSSNSGWAFCYVWSRVSCVLLFDVMRC
ncbi:hypothetical protein BDV93DRAFT_180616 [Ceratobasidium sp. AG-I]|nr:hypothetical protein BDV93DRAFT_180616 [Ceratobasidium sp. AG-I]